MSTGEHFPLFFAGESRGAFSSEALCRRVARIAHWNSSSRLLELCGGPASVFLAKELGCAITTVEETTEMAARVQQRARSHGVAERVTSRVSSFIAIDDRDGYYDGVLALGRVPLPLSGGLALRGLLAPKGRLVMTYPVRVGRAAVAAVHERWERKLGEKLLSPSALLLEALRAGFEPDSIETLQDSELDDLYIEQERDFASVPELHASALEDLKEEIALHRANGGKTGLTLAVAVLRRREPGERPPPARERG